MGKYLSAGILLLHLLLSGNSHGAEAPVTKLSEVAIIIDDLGYSKSMGKRALLLPGALTYAIIPHSPNSLTLAHFAQAQQKEVMLHAPMSNVHGRPLGKLGLTEFMSETVFTQALNEAIASVPFIRGVNNHMGSRLTQKQQPMEWTMKTLSEHGLYFIDSRTTSHSVAWRTAQQSDVPSLKRDVFLDNNRDPEQIHQQFSRLVDIAKDRGFAVAIAHPYPETLTYLAQKLPTLADQGIKLVSASTLVYRHSPNQKRIQARLDH